ncbi:3'(2'),5'-bisphosphate nucleotidase CysQ family protein [Nocardiopsis lambiniae]|uniref:inositol-phosphate phosphatase n=1 Tax=Nocardiopsis lambiniae TaxID=3075539 RepID=A0ABU2M7F6_9ACTN|nr:inositol monophosphatase family protein [Nocardiopsis sp. DSM 44743]MDT0328592.1 inositol monophosphatase family protein [Nocardiopsis sp. DSM 44743]
MSDHPLTDAVAEAVTEVGGLLRVWRDDAEARRGVWEGSQFKAEADARAHRALSERLTAIDADIPVISEEDPESLRRERPSRYWLIDPIDGTASYVHGFPGYVTQAALVIGDRPEIAAVFAPETGALYTAVRGRGARRDGRPLPPLPAAPPGYGVLTDNTPEPHGIAARVHGRFGYDAYLESGSISLKLCLIAEGAAHLFVKDVPVRDWDVAAPGLVLEEAGGLLTRLDGTPFDYRGGYEHTGLVGGADPSTCRTVARWLAAG